MCIVTLFYVPLTFLSSVSVRLCVAGLNARTNRAPPAVPARHDAGRALGKLRMIKAIARQRSSNTDNEQVPPAFPQNPQFRFCDFEIPIGRLGYPL